MMEEVYPNIFMITEYGALGAVMPPVNIYVLAGPNGLIFDSGYARKGILSHLGKEIRRIEERVRSRGEIFRITRALPSHSHPDHASGLRYLKKKFGVKIVLTEKMLANLNSRQTYYRGSMSKQYSTGFVKNTVANLTVKWFHPLFIGMDNPRKADEIIAEPCRLSVNNESWQVLPAPGHCDDHISLYNEATGVLFSGDNILRVVTTWLGPPRSDLAQYRQTLEQILALPKLELILSAHGRPITNPRQRIREILAHRRERTQEIIDIIKKSGSKGVTPRRIVNTIYKPWEIQQRYSADGWVVLTLKKLQEEGWIKNRGNRFFLRSQSTDR